MNFLPHVMRPYLCARDAGYTGVTSREWAVVRWSREDVITAFHQSYICLIPIHDIAFVSYALKTKTAMLFSSFCPLTGTLRSEHHMPIAGG